MKVRVLFFGQLADACGTRETFFNVEPKATISDLLVKATHRYESLSQHKLLVAINEEYSDSQAPLNEGDEVALFTAVSGG